MRLAKSTESDPCFKITSGLRSRASAYLAFPLLAVLCPIAAFAEYRVYELAITNADTGQTRTVITTLDDRQYGGYHPLHLTESVKIEATWMCWGRHGESKPPCPRPTSSSDAPLSAPVSPP